MAKEKKSKFVVVLVLYLAGLFMGALDTGIVTPARTVIQNALSVDASTGIWMITIYTLFYAASIPIMGKIADIYGRKYVYLASIFLFGLGSLFCGLSSYFGGFGLLVVSRAVQAIGGGGIMPIATAEFGTSFPPEKRGMALGLVGGVFGIANVFGASVGSAIMDLFGTEHWAYIFFINVPITIVIVAFGLFTLDNTKVENTTKLDFVGIATLTAMIFSLLYGLKSLDFFDFSNSIKEPEVYICLLIFIILLPVFIMIERRAQDPVMNLHYFSDKNIALALAISMMSGFVMMGMIFVPQFSENVLHMATGSGGYLVIILGLFAGASAPVSGKMTDKFGAKAVLMAGFIISAMGSLFLIFITTKYGSFISVMIGLMLIGLGMGFTMGTPLNYIMLANTDDKESNSALAAMSLVRSIGTAVAPAIMVGFISHAGMAVSENIMAILPQDLSMPELPYQEELMDKIEEMKNSPDTADMMKDMPDMSEMTSMKMDMDAEDSDFEMPADLLDMLQNSDVTNIAENMVVVVDRMFDEMIPTIIDKIDTGMNEGINGMETGRKELLDAVSGMQKGYDGISQGINGMAQGIQGMSTAIEQLKSYQPMMQMLPGGQVPAGKSLLDYIPGPVQAKIPQDTLDMLAEIKSADDLSNKISELETEKTKLIKKRKSSIAERAEMASAMSEMKEAAAEMLDTENKMQAYMAALPDGFKEAKVSYVEAVKDSADEIEVVFQDTLNGGFKSVYWTSFIAAVVAILLLVFYSSKQEKERMANKTA